ncbi:hypothetical protein ABW16_19440 [Mycolicibacter heraklionensis]|uniref:Schlafen AlbA-2 domain-containing protein n=2 Tax=Mycolicibacter heraklionensis TaxID=512402 RepID=A0ABR5FB21_9MYCO|nr:hypothetical protein ABW16_19440 [Mycolicibacter heraklionensis]
MRTPDELLGLVEAIHNSPVGTQETNWLEWKNGLDISTTAGKFAIAKAILGFMNRSVEQAHLVCEGVAYVVIGVEPGAADGVASEDHAKLDQRLKTYVDGPRWTPFYVLFSRVEVLVIVVEPPRAGDQFHTLQKEFDKYRAGTIFHRGAAQSAPAGPKEIQMLENRLLAGVRQPELDLTLTGVAEPLIRLSIEREQFEDWLRRHAAYVRATSGRPPEPPPRTPTGSPVDDVRISELAMQMFGRYADPRDAEEFEQRLNTYMSAVTRRLLDNVLRNIVLDDDANTVRFRVGNETDDPVTGVQLTVHIPKGGLIVRTAAPSVDELPPPKWPEPLVNQLRIGTLTRVPQSVPPYSHPITRPRSGSVVKTSDSFEVTWDLGDIRPHDWSRTVMVTVIPFPNAPERLNVELVARAMDRRGICTATTLLTIGSGTWAIDDFYDAAPRH